MYNITIKTWVNIERKTKNEEKISMLLSLVMLPGMVAGCGSSDKKNAESSDGQTVITIANGSSEEDAKTYEIMQEQKEEFEAENTDLCDGSYRKPGI